MTQSQSSNEQVTTSSASDEAPLTDLYKMSPTAGVATTDYASINTLAIVTLLLGLATLLVLAWPDLLFIPVAGLICGVVSLRQISASNGTQVGRGMAWAGLAASLLLGGGTSVYLAVQDAQLHAQEVAIDTVIRRFGQDIKTENYDAAYAECSADFQNRVPLDLFRAGVATLNGMPQLGRVTGMSWNGEKMIVQRNADTGEERATAMAFEQMEKYAEPGREVFGFLKVDGQWKIDEFPRLFPRVKEHKKP